MQTLIDNSVVLITGGTGSFGKTMVRHLLQGPCQEIRIFSRDEWKQDEMRGQLSDPRLRYIIGDVRNRASVDGAMNGVKLVFHAAALKQVPSCEFFPMEAVQTNVVGSFNVVESAIQHDVSCVVCLGTDKAVYPINTMGMTKAIMEKVAQAAARRESNGGTRICSVRYGNVMYSRGSVIPLFVRQIKMGSAITITNPEMTRFMLPLRQSVDLVEYAFQNGDQGDIFIRKAPACTIRVLAQALKDLFESNADIQVIGTRHGEKVHETLANVEELRRAEDCGDYFRIRMDGRSLEYAKYFTEGEIDTEPLADYTSENTRQLNVAETRDLLLTLPEIEQELGHRGPHPTLSERNAPFPRDLAASSLP